MNEHCFECREQFVRINPKYINLDNNWAKKSQAQNQGKATSCDYDLKLVSLIFIKVLFFHQMIALQKLKIFVLEIFIFCISAVPSFSACRLLL